MVNRAWQQQQPAEQQQWIQLNNSWLVCLLQSGREDLGWMFCPYSGYMLEFDPLKGTATCPQSGYTRRLEGEQQLRALDVVPSV